jgi:hypothetical protein
MATIIKVRARITFQLFEHGKSLVPGPVAQKGQVMEVVDIERRTLEGKSYDHFVVLVDGKKYYAWPPHCEKA